MSDINDKNQNNKGENFEGLGKLLDHNYDNIRELDNPLPGWWLFTFWATIVFAVGYYAYYELMGGPSSDQELQSALAEIKAKSGVEASTVAGAPGSSDSTGGGTNIDFAALALKPEVLALGKTHYEQKCFACHGKVGEGTIGPNLTDEYWIHGKGSPQELYNVINAGVLEKGMPAWGQQMKPDELQAVTVFVLSLAGTKPANGKAPQGNKVESH